MNQVVVISHDPTGNVIHRTVVDLPANGGAYSNMHTIEVVNDNKVVESWTRTDRTLDERAERAKANG